MDGEGEVMVGDRPSENVKWVTEDYAYLQKNFSVNERTLVELLKVAYTIDVEKPIVVERLDPENIGDVDNDQPNG